MPESTGRFSTLIIYSPLADNIDVMFSINVKSLDLFAIVLLLLIFGCESAHRPKLVANSAMVDSLVSIVDQATTAVADRRYPDFLELIDPHERGGLDRIVKAHGYSSLKTYLDQQMHGWPNTDTLILADFVADSTHARITFAGNGSDFGRRATIRYTIVMLRQTHVGWRVTAMTSLEKDASDQYGNPLTYHETELPLKLRFPRPI